VDKEDRASDQAKPRWFIDLDWYQQNNRSFLTLARGCLCLKCQERLKEEISVDTLLATIKDCCSQTQGFITRESPILKSIFCFFLANGNQPLDLEELGRQLREWRSGDTYCTSPEVLSRLLKKDQYYGLRQAKA